MNNQSESGPLIYREFTFHADANEQHAPARRVTVAEVARKMRIVTSYHNAIRSFQELYIVEVPVSHSCHMGRSAAELGMHRNTLTRIVRELNIDVKQIRRSQLARFSQLRTVETVNAIRSHCQDTGDCELERQSFNR